MTGKEHKGARHDRSARCRDVVGSFVHGWIGWIDRLQPYDRPDISSYIQRAEDKIPPRYRPLPCQRT